MRISRSKWVLLSLLLLLVNGCMSFSDRSFRPVIREISAQIPNLNLRKEFALSIGSVMFNVIDAITVGSDFDFSSIDKVQIAVYEVGFSADLRKLNVEKALMARDPSLSWQTVIKIREEREYTWIVMGINENRASIEAVSILVMGQGELVLINLNGDLEKIIEFAFEPVKGKKGVIKFS